MSIDYNFLDSTTNELKRNSILSRTPNIIENKPNYKINNHRKIIYSFMSIFTSVYLLSETLQTSSLISSHDHNQVTQNSYAYNLLFVLMATYSLFIFSNIETNKKPNVFLYWFFCISGAFGFALLGEIPFLKNIVITKDWWKRLPMDAWVVVGFFTLIVLYCAFKECRESRRDKRCCLNIFKIVFVLFTYLLILILLASTSADGISYHVHHAIFAGLLSMWFLDWDSILTMSMHAILMGIVIEGINFYSIQEFFLFIVGNEPVDNEPIMIISIVFTVISAILIKCIY